MKLSLITCNNLSYIINNIKQKKNKKKLLKNIYQKVY